MKRISTILLVISLLMIPAAAHAGIWKNIGTAWSAVVERWQAGTIGSDGDGVDESGEDADAGDEGDADAEEDDSDGDEPTVPSASGEGMCRVPQSQPERICEVGMGFLCVNTPDYGVAEEWAVIRGTVDRDNSVVTAINVVSQHEYTKETISIDTTDPEIEACWTSSLEERPFCLDEQGFFAARVPLPRLGPYTISVNASRLSGSSMEQSVRLSRVVAPELPTDAVSFDPDILESPHVSDAMVNVIVELLGDCQFCDFIGASTGAVTVTVTNTISSDDGNVRTVSCATNIEQGGQGRFVIGVPAGAGTNALEIEVCNAAVEGGCPGLSGFAFSGPVEASGFEIVRPEPLPAYDAERYPVIEWEFRLEGLSTNACVNVQFNRQKSEQVCADGDVFRMTLHPVPGINVVTVETEGVGGKTVHPWTFGWGRIASPFDEGGSVTATSGLVASDALQLAVPAHTMIDVIQPLVSNFISSDAFGPFVTQMVAAVPDTRGDEDLDEDEPARDERAESIETIRDSIEGCQGGGGLMEGKRLEVVGSPTVGAARIEGMAFESERLSLSLNTDDVELRLRLVTDVDGDGVPDSDPLPLLIAFRKAIFDVSLSQGVGVDGRRVFMISSPYTDCDYKSGRYCKGIPAPLIPKNFVGAATSYGGFVRCDTAGQQVSADMKRLCNALNSLNAQTGLIGEKVLDAVNGLLGCTGSAVLTHILRGGTRGAPQRVGCFPDDPEDGRSPLMGCTSGTLGTILGPWLVSLGVDMGDGLRISADGLHATANLRVGDEELFASTIDQRLHHPSVGVIVDPATAGASPPIASARTDKLLRVALSTDAINHLLFLLSHQSYDGEPTGLLDLDVSEVLFKRLGFDFVEECDAFEVEAGTDSKPSSLCTIRPRVGELLGTSLTTYKYFDQNHPLLMRLKGNRALTPFLRIVSLDDIPIASSAMGEEEGDHVDVPTGNLIDLQLGGVGLSFYALEIDETVPLDEYGNPTILLDGEGNPVIRSLRPDDPDPDQGQIISFELTLLLALEIGDVVSDPDDPTRFIIALRPLADRSRLVLTPVVGSNATTVPSEALVPPLREKLSYAISIFSARDKALKIPIPKRIELMPAIPSPDSLMRTLGLQHITLGPDGLTLAWDEGSSFMTIDLDGVIRQIVQRDGESFTEDLPR